jgi:GWxTD domain-containing protein
MSRKCFTILFLFSICIVVLFSTVSFAQQQPQDKPPKVKKEKKDAYKKWLEEVSPILTEEEKKAFLKLETDDERETFIAEVWIRRDPDPDTEINEFKEEYYERMQYANEHFSSGIPGWKTDRGQIYLRWGKPDSIESHPTGGQYDRPYYEGGGSTSTYPFEIWFYRNLPGIDSGLEFEFVDKTGSGEYKLAYSPDEKDALLYIPGAGQTLAETYFGVSKTERILGRNNLNYGRAQDSPFERLRINSAAFGTPPVNRRQSIFDTTDAAIDNNAIEFDMRVDFYKMSDERVAAMISIQTENRGLQFTNNAGIETATLNISGNVISVADRRVGRFEEVVSTTTTLSELRQAKERKSVYQKSMTLLPGTYKVQALVRDVKTGAAGRRVLSFNVPKYEEGKLSTSSLVLASRLQNKTDEMQGNIFVIGAHKVIPNIANTYQRGQEVGIYLQIYNAGIDETTLRPNVEVDYVLQKDGKELMTQKEDWQGLSDSGQRLVLARLLPTASLYEGEYELLIKIRDRVSGQLLMPRATFSISK